MWQCQYKDNIITEEKTSAVEYIILFKKRKKMFHILLNKIFNLSKTFKNSKENWDIFLLYYLIFFPLFSSDDDIH